MLDRIILTFSEKCNMHCPFCYGFFNGIPYSFERCIEIINQCFQNGIRRIHFAGGDPLLIKDINELVDYVIAKGMSTSMDTNALMFDKSRHYEMAEKLEMISFPLDGPTKEIHDRARNYEGSFDKIIYALQILNDNAHIRINTVVVKHNYKYLYELFQVLRQFNLTEWHIYECIPLEKGYSNYREVHVDYNLYADAVDKIKTEKSHFIVEHTRIPDRVRRHLYIACDGTLYTNDFDHLNKYIYWGNADQQISFNKAFDYLREERENRGNASEKFEIFT